MLNLIHSVDLKLDRAEFHIHTLADQVSQWVASNPINFRCELRESRLGFRLIVEPFSEAPLDNWGLLTGECVHNLRSSLDNLAFALARLRQDPPTNPRKIHFPICEDRSSFESNRVRNSLDQLPPEAASFIESLQPFQRLRPEVEGTPETDALLRLHLLNITDKHRIPPIVLLAPTKLTLSWSVEFYSDEDAVANTPPDVTVNSALQPNAMILEYRTNRPIQRAKGASSATAIVALQFIDKHPPVIKFLGELGYYTALIVEQFRRFFQ